MSDWNGFGGLDLSGVEAGGGARLQPGVFIVSCKSAEVKPVGNTANRKLVLELADVEGTGDVRVNLNIHHESQKAKEVGLSQLKSFLIAGKHPSPDRPGDVATMQGLRCKVIVGLGSPWRNDKGNEVQSSEVKKFLLEAEGPPVGLAQPAAAPVASYQAPITPPSDLDDDIPF